jgi:hypothetical protein
VGAPTNDLQESSKLQMQQNSEEKIISKPETMIFVSNVLKKKL